MESTAMRKHEHGTALVGPMLVLAALILGAYSFERINALYGKMRLQIQLDSAVAVAGQQGYQPASDLELKARRFLNGQSQVGQFAISSSASWFDNLTISEETQGSFRAVLALRKQHPFGKLLDPFSPGTAFKQSNLEVATGYKLSGLGNVAQFAAGREHSCARDYEGYVWCWGLNAFYALGPVATNSIGTTVSTKPTLAVSDAIQLEVGGTFSCALITGQTNEIKCWGSLPDGLFNDRDVIEPEKLLFSDPNLNPIQIAVGQDAVCAVFSDGTSECYWPRFGLGVGKSSGLVSGICAKTAPLAINNATLVELGSSFGCVTTNQDVYCFGLDRNYQLGFTAATEPSLGQICPPASTGRPCESGTIIPFKVPGLPSQPVALLLGRDSACSQFSDGSVWCWGDNQENQLGRDDAATVTESLPRPTTVLPADIDLTRSQTFFYSSHYCGLVSSSTSLFCWGSNETAQLGLDDSDASQGTVASTWGDTDAITVGQFNTCAISSLDGSVWCLGSFNKGLLGRSLPGGESLIPIAGVSFFPKDKTPRVFEQVLYLY